MDGALIERGMIDSVTENGYIVTSYIRAGVVTPEIPALGSNAFHAGDRVYFFLFDDGHGMILSAIP